MLENIKKNFEQLVSLYEQERQQRLQYASELENSKLEIEALKKRIVDLERQVDNHTLTDAFAATSDDHSVAKERIEKLIKEMDKCISLLEK